MPESFCVAKTTLTDEVVDNWLNTFDRLQHKVSQDILIQEMRHHGLTPGEIAYIVDRWLQEA